MGFGGKSQNVMDVSEWCIVTRTFSGEERLWVVLWENKVNGTQKLIHIGKMMPKMVEPTIENMENWKNSFLIILWSRARNLVKVGANVF